MTKSDSKWQLGKTVEHSFIYGFGTVLRHMTAFLMLPIYTRYLTPSDYGVVELLTMAIELVSILVGMRITQAVLRYYILAKDEWEKRAVVSTILLLVIGGSGIGVVLLYLISVPLVHLIFGNIDYLYELRIFSFSLIFNSVWTVGISYLRARQMPVLFVSVSVLLLFLQVALNIIFVVILEMHVLGVVYSALISGFIVAMATAISIFMKVGLHFSRPMFFRLVRFVSPLIVASLGAFYASYVNQYFLRVFGTIEDVGIYSLALRLASVMTVVTSAFQMSWGADRYNIVKMENAREVYDQVFRTMAAAVIILGAGLSLFAEDLILTMTTPAFYPASSIVPIVVAAFIVRVFTRFCNFGILLKERTKDLAYAAWIEAIVATMGCIILIPYLGILGAAIALTVSSMAEFGWVYSRSKQLYDMGLNWGAIAIMAVLAGISISIGSMLPSGELNWFLTRIVIITVLVVLIYKAPIWSEVERQMFGSAIRRLLPVWASKVK